MRKLLTFEILIHLSDRDFYKVLGEMEKTTILHAYKNVESKYLERIRRVFDEKGNTFFTKDLESIGDVPDEDARAARNQIAAVADQLLSEDELDDWHIRRA
jgi:flagellar motor switch protein FliG